ncbi:hypothetical protein [Sphingorhabdus sp. Alg231-15]|uniref:hypothetical protein n=1 Tax=Sphingorhabdus sp. Alg231-15 TaxID=1922222 RepID=UPI000D558734
MPRFNLLSDPSRRSVLHRGGRIVKWKGSTASMVPHIAELRLTVSAAAVGAALIFGAGFGGTAPALAGTCVESAAIPNSFTCSGPSDADTDVEQVLGGVAVAVSTVEGFGIAVDNADAFEISGIFGARFEDIQDSYSAIVGRENGILITNAGGGLLSVTSTSTIRGQTRSGISATNFAGGTDLTIASNDTGGALDGIYALNQGTGVLTITATGMTSSVNTDGIYAVNEGTDLTITAADVTAADHGINAGNEGTGDLTINVTGAVIADGDDGILAVNGNGTTDLTITSNVVTGAERGISATSTGNGALTITSTGTATGFGSVGIYAYNQTATTTSLSVTAADVTGTAGIYALNNGSEGLTITTTGDIRGETFDGISAYNDANGGALTYMEINQAEDTVIYGRDNGIFANNFGGSLTIYAQGTVRGDTESGINAYNRAGTENLRITSNIARGRFDGIDADNQGNGSLIISSTGSATGDYYNGIEAFNSANGTSLIINAAEATGGSEGHGIYAQNYGTGSLTISVTGDVTGQGEAGIFAYNSANAEDGMVINQDAGSTITGATDGIYAENLADALTINALGTAVGLTGGGIEARNRAGTTDLTIVSNIATGSTNGIRASNEGSGALTITSTGIATATGDDAISASNFGTDLTINAVDTDGAERGITASNEGTGALTIISTGTATGTEIVGIRAYNSANGTSLSITAADVIGGINGIYAQNYGDAGLTISTTGDVTGQGQAGIHAYNNADVNVATFIQIDQAAATTITGATDGIYAENYGGALIINALGTVNGDGGDGIDARNRAGTTDLTITSNVATGESTGIYALNEGSGELTITSTDTARGTSSYGIYAINRGTDLTINAVNTDGSLNAILAINEGSEALTIDSTGTAIGDDFSAIDAFNSNAGTNLTVNAVNTDGGQNGIVAFNDGDGALTINSTGTAMGTNYDGINAFNSASGTNLTVNAVDTSGGESGIDARNSGAGALTISTTGDATGQGQAGIYAYNSANGSLMQIDQAEATIITGATDGVFADNRGGSMTISALGTVVGETEDGIEALNAVGTADLTIVSDVVEGAGSGINVFNGGNGALTVTSTGMADGASSSGIAAFNFFFGTDLIITAADTSGGQYGINALNIGTGALNITSTGLASGTDNEGIIAVNSADGTALSISAAEVTGGTYGIRAFNRGTGILTISATGDVTGQTQAGIFAYNSGNAEDGTEIDQDAGTTTTGTTDGIYADNLAGPLTINALGTSIGEAGDGINARNRLGTTDLTITSNVANGSVNGIDAVNQGGGALTITSTGSASGGAGDGIYAYNSINGGNLAVTAVNSSGSDRGIFANNEGDGTTIVTSTGTASGTAGAGIRAVNTANGNGVTVNALDTSGTFGISVNNRGEGALIITSAGTATGLSLSGIGAYNSTNGTDLTVDAVNASGNSYGIVASNFGEGPLSVTSTGSAIGNMGGGILAYNLNGTSLSITAADVIGGTAGIDARNFGSAGLTISVSGDVTGQSADGIYAYNSANDVSASMVINRDVGTTTTGADDGIDADNFGGSLTINALGTTIGLAGDGINANNGPGTTDLTITSNVAEGAVSGIDAVNQGNGALTITSTASASGGAGDGIYAFNAINGGNLAVTAVNSSGGDQGIYARNDGESIMIVTSTGSVSGIAGEGIRAVNNLLTTGMTVNAMDTSGTNGISTSNLGEGALTITSTGTATGTAGDGIDALNGLGSGDLQIISNAATGEGNGISAVNEGNGALTIISTGTVTGSNISGIDAFNAATGTAVSITAADVTGGVDGINVVHEGTGAAEVTTTGTVTGGTGNAIMVATTGSTITVNNSGTLESGAGFALAAGGGVTDLTNSGTINGRVQLTAFDDLTVNNGLFNASLDSDFGTGNDLFTNDGTLTLQGAVTLLGLEQFANNGLIDMRNGTAGNLLVLPDDYTSNGALGVDVNFDGAGSADILTIGGTVSGNTSLFIDDISTSPNFGNTVLVVDTGAGTAEDAFALADQSATIGFFAYSLSFDAAEGDFFLTNAIAVPTFQTLKFAEGAQSLWYRSADAWAAHMASRRTASDSPLWMQVYGSLTQQDDNFEFTSSGFTQTISLDYDQDYFGFQTGYDFAPAFGNEDVVIGLTGGYLSSDLGFEGTADNVHYDAFNIGVYAGINSGRFFVNALAKYDFIDANVRARTAGYNANLDGQAYGIRLEAGYRWGDDTFFIQPLASVEYQLASLDDFSALGADIDFDSFNGLRGMAGVRLGGEASVNGSNRLTYYLGGQAVHQSQNGDGLVFTSGASSIEVENRLSNTFGRFELGVNIASPGGVTGFIEGNADIGGGYTGYGGRTGLKIEF